VRPGPYDHEDIFSTRRASERRTEVEAVATELIDKLTLEAFTCVANAAWAAPTSLRIDGNVVMPVRRQASRPHQGGRDLTRPNSVSFKRKKGLSNH
jgi:hypothetical protein